MDDRSSLYCVIGAGPVGLSVARALAKAGIGYEQLEADADVGGNWRHGVYSSAHIISSRKTTEYADYPMPADYPDFPSAEQMRAYLADYVDHFDLRRHIQFNTRVEFCRPLNRPSLGSGTWPMANAGFIAACWCATDTTGTCAGPAIPANSPESTSTPSNTEIPISCVISACW